MPPRRQATTHINQVHNVTTEHVAEVVGIIWKRHLRVLRSRLAHRTPSRSRSAHLHRLCEIAQTQELPLHDFKSAAVAKWHEPRYVSSRRILATIFSHAAIGQRSFHRRRRNALLLGNSSFRKAVLAHLVRVSSYGLHDLVAELCVLFHEWRNKLIE